MICASEIFSNLNHWVYSHCAALFLSSCGNWGLENKFEKIAILWSLMASLVAQTVKCLHPWVGKIPWRRKWQLTPVLLSGKSHGQRSLVGYNPWGHKESDTTERLHSLHLAEYNTLGSMFLLLSFWKCCSILLWLHWQLSGSPWSIDWLFLVRKS